VTAIVERGGRLFEKLRRVNEVPLATEVRTGLTLVFGCDSIR
jgi:hypothetical protein